MSKNKEIINTETKGISEEEAMERLTKEKSRILSDFANAYLAETGIAPSELELVVKEVKTNSTIEITYSFRRKNA